MPNIVARFDLPERFIEAHSAELLTWARELEKWGALLKIKLKRSPLGPVDVVAGTLPVDVTLACELWKSAAGGTERVFRIKPYTAYDAEMIAIYADKLPAIEASRTRYLEERRLAEAVVAVVERIPTGFVEAYRDEILAWGRDFCKRGTGTTIVLRRIKDAPVELDDWGQPPMLAVDLVAKVQQRRDGRIELLIKPADEQSEALAARHAQEIARYGEPQPRRAH